MVSRAAAAVVAMLSLVPAVTLSASEVPSPGMPDVPGIAAAMADAGLYLVDGGRIAGWDQFSIDAATGDLRIDAEALAALDALGGHAITPPFPRVELRAADGTVVLSCAVVSCFSSSAAEGPELRVGDGRPTLSVCGHRRADLGTIRILDEAALAGLERRLAALLPCR